MFFLALISLLVPLSNCQYEAVMVRIFAKLENWKFLPSDIKNKIGVKMCTDQCWDDKECILAYMDSDGNCLRYVYSDFVETQNVVKRDEKDLIVAIKTNKITCPDVFTTMDFAYYDRVDNANTPFQWTTTATGWSLIKTATATTTIETTTVTTDVTTQVTAVTTECVDPWKQFQRTIGGDHFVCMRRYSISGLDYDGASKFCQDKGYKMTGVQETGESEFLLGDKMEDVWIDGTTECDPDVANCQDQYTWHDGYTTEIGTEKPTHVLGTKNAHCMYLPYEENTYNEPSTFPCTKTTPTVVGCGFKMANPQTF